MWRTKGTFHREERREREGTRPFHFRWALGKAFSCEVRSVLYCLKDKAIAMAANRLQIQGDDSVLLRITHANLKTFSADIHFSLQVPILQTNLLYFFSYSKHKFENFLCLSLSQSTVDSVKEKLWKKCGTSVNSMCLELYDDTNTKLSDLSDNSRPLGFYSPLNGYIPISFPFLKVAFLLLLKA